MKHGRRPNVTRAALRAYFPNSYIQNRLVPMPDFGCIYVKNPKVASSAILLWLHRIHTGDHQFSVRNIHSKHTLPSPKDVGWDTVIRMLEGDAVCFAFVRDPIQRVESAYMDKVVRKRTFPGRLKLQRILGLQDGPEHDLTLDQFVAALEAQEPLEMDLHWRPQHLNLMHGLVEYDLIGRLETFDTDLARLRELTGLPNVPVKAQNQTRKSSSSLFDGRPGLLRRVRNIYARDLELYGY